MSKRVERLLRDQASVRELKRLLKDVCDDPKSYIDDETLSAALASQGSLAAYKSTARSITPMSLNHLKTVANAATAYDDERDPELPGFTHLDNLRKQAATALRRTAAPADEIGRASGREREGEEVEI